jgi:NAD(P)-dependent dehydrogenase (short-subunit alcohol dehydrogenase family)
LASRSDDWTEAEIPDQSGRTALITGANSGIGLGAAHALASKGARVILACRNREKAVEASRSIARDHPGATLEIVPLDLADLASIREAARRVRERVDSIDLLINNAGLMGIPRSQTSDGFEMQLGTNHLGHFALTGLLLEKLLASPDSRVVTVTSATHKAARLAFDDLNGEIRYNRFRAYGQSKLANLLFSYELQRRLESSRSRTHSLAAHPGVVRTNIAETFLESRGLRFLIPLHDFIGRHFYQDPAMGALPSLRAATDPRAAGGDFYGPRGFGQMRGYPVKVESSRRSHFVADAERLWKWSEDVTGVRFDALSRAIPERASGS